MSCKAIRIYDASLHTLALCVTASTCSSLAQKLATRFDMRSVPTHLYRLVSAPPNRQVDESATPLDLLDNKLFETLEDGGLYSIHEKVFNVAFSASPTSPLCHIDLPISRYRGDLMAEVKKAMLLSYNLAPDSPCDIKAVVAIVHGQAATIDIPTVEVLEAALEKSWPLRISIDREARGIAGVEVGIRNIVELAIKMLMVFGNMKSTPTKILKELGFLDRESPPFMYEVFRHLAVPMHRRTSVWRSFHIAYDQLSSQVLHIQFDQMMPTWDEVNETEEVECFSPTRRSIPALHVDATRKAKEIIKYLVGRGLNENLVMTTFYLRSLCRASDVEHDQFQYGKSHFRGEQVNLYLDPNEYIEMGLKDIYTGMAGGDEKLTAWAKERLLSMYTDEAVQWPEA